MNILDLLASDNYICLNRTLAKLIGLENAILFGVLCGYQKAYGEEEFYKEQPQIMEDSCLSEYLVRKSLKELQELNFITITRKGMPSKYYYKINVAHVFKILSSSCAKSATTCGAKSATTGNKDIYSNNIINKNELNKNESTPHTPQGVGAKSEVEEIVSYLNEKLGTHYKPNTAKTITLIKARRKEGFTVQDFKTVIDKKVKEWKGTEREEYLRPETLFGTKFEGYLNQKTYSKNENSEKEEKTTSKYDFSFLKIGK